MPAQWRNTGGTETKNIKNSLLAMPVLRTCRWCYGMSDFKQGLESVTPHPSRRPLTRSVASPKGSKPLAFGEKPNPVETRYFTSAHNCDTILNTNYLTRTRSIASLPCKIVSGNLTQPPSCKSFYHQGFFAVKRRAVFILGAMW